jgi:outer membrane protein assembly factor BamB
MTRVISVILAASVILLPSAVPPFFSRNVRAQVEQNVGTSVTWASLVNCTAAGGSLEKAAGRDDTYDAGATSAEEIGSGDLFFEFTAAGPDKALFCGLAHSPIGTDFEDIDFAIKLTTFGVAEVRENNIYRTEVPYFAGDVFQIRIQGNVVGYYRNEIPIYASLRGPLFPLRIEATLASVGARIYDATIRGSSITVPADWRMYQHDEAHSAYAGNSAINATNVTSLSQAWSFQTQGRVTATPVVSGGVVYVGSWDGHMYALRESDGSELWSYDAGTIRVDQCQTTYGIDSTAALWNGRLFFGTGQAELHAIDASNGQRIWKTQLADSGIGFHIWGSPVVFNARIYVGLASHCVNPCVGGKLLCVDANDGHVIWTFNTAPAGSLGGAVWSSVAADAGRRMVYVGTGNYCSGTDTHSTAVIALDAATGALIWEFKKLYADLNNLDFGASPVLFDVDGQAALAIPCKDGHVYALDRSNGRLIWDRVVTDGDSRGGSISTPSAAFGKIFLGATVHLSTGKVLALDQRDGRTLWETPLERPVLGAAATAGGLVFVGGDDGKIHAFDASTGREAWSELRSPMWGGVSISKDKIFVGSVDRTVYAFALNAAPPPPPLTITSTSPTTGDVWPVKSKRDITWIASPGVEKVDVSVSRDGGATWNVLMTGIDASTGSARIKIKKPRSKSAILKVSDSSNQSVFGLSGVFILK